MLLKYLINWNLFWQTNEKLDEWCASKKAQLFAILLFPIFEYYVTKLNKFFSIAYGIRSYLMFNLWFDLEKCQYEVRIYIATLL